MASRFPWTSGLPWRYAAVNNRAVTARKASVNNSSARLSNSRVWEWLLVLGATAIAIVSARPYPGGWNDRSRLATVECLVDYHTFAIDQSVFVRRPRPSPGETAPPDPASDPESFSGTRDKVLINGHYYSDKSPLPSLMMAAVYRLVQWCTGLTAREHDGRFCYAMTVTSCGPACVIAVWCVYRLAVVLALPFVLRLGLPISLGLATLALTYTRQVNQHILLLAVAAGIAWGLAQLARDVSLRPIRWRVVLILGALTGFGYTIDLGAGPPLLACTFAVAAYRCRRLALVAVLVVAALPWLAVHYAVNYAIGGTWKPIGAVPEFLDFPGSAFGKETMTGLMNHASVPDFLEYAFNLLLGPRGFLTHEPTLFLALAGFVLLLGKRVQEWPELLWAACWSGGTWLIYALLSNNYCGQCASIRWFLPLLAPGYYVIGVLLRYRPRLGWVLLALSLWGAVDATITWQQGPWETA
jgi:hypothetical protein